MGLGVAVEGALFTPVALAAAAVADFAIAAFDFGVGDALLGLCDALAGFDFGVGV